MYSMNSNKIKRLQPRILADWIRSYEPSNQISLFLVVDVRDTDYIDGVIKRSLHVPFYTFTDDSTLSDLMKYVIENHFEHVIFHCTYSAVRGPSAAKIFQKSLQELDQIHKNDILDNLNIYVLDGGWERWNILYGSDIQLTEKLM